MKTAHASGVREIPSGIPHNPRPWRYFLLVYALSVPFWLFGGRKLPLPMNLPASSLMWITPTAAASILLYREQGRGGVSRFLRRAFDSRGIRARPRPLAIAGVVPASYLAVYGIMRLAGRPLPDPVEVPVLLTPVLFLTFLAPAIAEELGWSGYATDPLQARWGAFRAAVLLGIVWQVWHIIPNLQIGHPAGWIWGHSVYSVALRVLIVWTYNATGKGVLAASLVHTIDNVSWSLFPNNGSHLDPWALSLVAWPLILAAVAGRGPGMFSRIRRLAHG